LKKQKRGGRRHHLPGEATPPGYLLSQGGEKREEEVELGGGQGLRLVREKEPGCFPKRLLGSTATKQRGEGAGKTEKRELGGKEKKAPQEKGDRFGKGSSQPEGIGGKGTEKRLDGRRAFFPSGGKKKRES